MKPSYLALVFVLIPFISFSQEPQRSEINPRLLNQQWEAQWIAPPDVSLEGFGVFYFRKTFEYTSDDRPFVVNVSADNRYKLYVNGQYIGNGPARGDLDYWRFETYDISSYLRSGKNVVSAVVWNFGNHIPYAQITRQTGFIVQGNSARSSVLNTDDSWKVYQDKQYEPIPVWEFGLNTFIVVGPGEKVDGSSYPWGWKEVQYDDAQWSGAATTGHGAPRGVGTNLERMLVPRSIPQMEQSELRMESVRRSDGMKVTDNFLKGDTPLMIPADSKVSFLIDQGHLTTAYPVIKVSGGMGAQIKVTYSEALYNEKGEKGNRNVVEGKSIKGYYDIFKPDGGEGRTFEPLWFRTYRYVKMDIRTADEPLTLNDIYGKFTAYPFGENASFSNSRSDLKNIWEVGWRTARLCAGETYFDCPYYEQLQYVGDTRIQALISLYVSGDERLMRNAINQFDHSRLPIGLTQSRYPTSVKQVIPPYSLFWVAMVHDYWMHRDDDVFVRDKLIGIQNVLHWYERHIDVEIDMLGKMQWWNFVDWAKPWPWDNEARIGGEPKGANKGGSSILTLQYAYVLQMAAELFNEFGDQHLAQEYESLAGRMIRGTRDHCWDEERGLISDTPGQNTFSQHANVMAILTGMFDENKARAVMERVLNEEDLIQTTFYYRFYVNRALQAAGMGDRYLETLGPWHQMLDLGLTTFAEKPDPTRSDCHAWSASPNYEFLATVVGINPASPGFETVEIAPHLGPLSEVQGKMPHPEGPIEVQLKKTGSNGIEGEVVLPEGLNGTFSWNGQTITLTGGRQEINMK